MLIFRRHRNVLRIGFPVERYDKKKAIPAFIIVRASHSISSSTVIEHYANDDTTPCNIALRKDTGASDCITFNSNIILDFQFDYYSSTALTSVYDINQKPTHLLYQGTSDTLTCALSAINSDAVSDSEGPIILLSAKIKGYPLHAPSNLDECVIEPLCIAHTKLDLSSLKAKWESAKYAHKISPTALVLHRTDAIALSNSLSHKLRFANLSDLKNLARDKPDGPILVPVDDKDIKQLRYNLGILDWHESLINSLTSCFDKHPIISGIFSFSLVIIIALLVYTLWPFQNTIITCTSDSYASGSFIGKLNSLWECRSVGYPQFATNQIVILIPADSPSDARAQWDKTFSHLSSARRKISDVSNCNYRIVRYKNNWVPSESYNSRSNSFNDDAKDILQQSHAAAIITGWSPQDPQDSGTMYGRMILNLERLRHGCISQKPMSEDHKATGILGSEILRADPRAESLFKNEGKYEGRVKQFWLTDYLTYDSIGFYFLPTIYHSGLWAGDMFKTPGKTNIPSFIPSFSGLYYTPESSDIAALFHTIQHTTSYFLPLDTSVYFTGDTNLNELNLILEDVNKLVLYYDKIKKWSGTSCSLYQDPDQLKHGKSKLLADIFSLLISERAFLLDFCEPPKATDQDGIVKFSYSSSYYFYTVMLGVRHSIFRGDEENFIRYIRYAKSYLEGSDVPVYHRFILCYFISLALNRGFQVYGREISDIWENEMARIRAISESESTKEYYTMYRTSLYMDDSAFDDLRSIFPYSIKLRYDMALRYIKNNQRNFAVSEFRSLLKLDKNGTIYGSDLFHIHTPWELDSLPTSLIRYSLECTFSESKCCVPLWSMPGVFCWQGQNQEIPPN